MTRLRQITQGPALGMAAVVLGAVLLAVALVVAFS